MLHYVSILLKSSSSITATLHPASEKFSLSFLMIWIQKFRFINSEIYSYNFFLIYKQDFARYLLKYAYFEHCLTTKRTFGVKRSKKYHTLKKYCCLVSNNVLGNWNIRNNVSETFYAIVTKFVTHHLRVVFLAIWGDGNAYKLLLITLTNNNKNNLFELNQLINYVGFFSPVIKNIINVKLITV